VSVTERVDRLDPEKLGKWESLLISEAVRAPSRGPELYIGPDFGLNTPGVSTCNRPVLVVRQSQGITSVGWFDPAQMPFQDASFNRVVLTHLIRDGGESELREACRVVTHDGTVMVLGLNRLGWVYLAQRKKNTPDMRLPGLAPLKVRRNLVEMGLRMESFSGAGIGGKSWKEGGNVAKLSRRLFTPVSDLLLLCACKADRPSMTRLRFGSSERNIQSAAMRG
jgi:hypothetical protein